MFRWTFAPRLRRLSPLILALPALAQAELIRPDTAIAGSVFDGRFVVENVINGSGMPPDFTTADRHAVYANNNHWTTQSNAIAAGKAWVEFGFDTARTLDTFHLWNHQSNGIASDAFYAVTQFDLTLMDADGHTLASLLDVAAVGGVGQSAVQSYSFAEVAGVTKVRFKIDQNGGSRFTGLAEVAFGGPAAPPIPEPGTWALMVAGLGAVGALTRRRF